MFADALEQGAIQIVHCDKAGALRWECGQCDDERVTGLNEARQVEIADL